MKSKITSIVLATMCWNGRNADPRSEFPQQRITVCVHTNDRTDVGAMTDEETGHIDMVVADRHEQRIDVVFIDFIHIRPRVQQEPRRLDVSFPRCVHQRSHCS
jgi:hypothetical protein